MARSGCWLMVLWISLAVLELVDTSPGLSHSLGTNTAGGQEAALRYPGGETSGCTRLHKRSLSQGAVRHVNASPRGQGAWGRAAAFTGSQGGLVWTPARGSSGLPADYPREDFTVELWVRPEGGQPNPAHILELRDNCSPGRAGRGWTLGIHTTGQDTERDARFFVHLHTGRARASSVLQTPTTYTAQRWVHIAVTYDGKHTSFFLDGSKVATDTKQRGALFSEVARQCKQLVLARETQNGNYFRGSLDELRIWNHAKKHHEIVKQMYNPHVHTSMADNLVLNEPFDDLTELWRGDGDMPDGEDSGVSDVRHDVTVAPPQCGHTICDDPAVIKSYAAHSMLRAKKTVRYRVINVLNDDGSQPTVTGAQVSQQDQALRDAFRPYNISWMLQEVQIRNTSLRRRTILHGCQPSEVGNGRCNRECKHIRTGNDGGDCDVEETRCLVSKKGDGKCDDDCNRKYHEWDGGDCCNPSTTDTSHTCFNPDSPHRAYLSIEEYKQLLGYSSERALNVYFAYWTDPDLLGVATFPWEKQVFTEWGGTVVQPDNYGKRSHTNNLVHEIGHNLGLWHVHHGVSEMECSDPCRETHASMELGDLCEDTNPTPQNTQCEDPAAKQNSCGEREFINTPYNNYMSYSGSSCPQTFSPLQVARMHCYLDLVYQPWQETPGPVPLPLPPRLMSVSASSLMVAMVPPMGSGASATDPVCMDCLADHSLLQFAYEAWSPNPSKAHGFWAPHQATGGPDAAVCRPSPHVWLPDVLSCTSCFIELTFKFPVKPKRLLLWVAWNAAGGVEDIELLFKDGSSTSLGAAPAFCDMPYTAELDLDQLVVKVRVHTSSPYVGIDAVQLISQPENPRCATCPDLKYRVSREPPFSSVVTQGRGYMDTSEPGFQDRDIESGLSYAYSIRTMLGQKLSVDSWTVQHTVGEPFCGDGVVNGEEQCDDGNVVNSDGCSLQCQLQEGFHCSGEPSMCFRPQEDGVCQEFEETKTSSDCGFYTPEGFQDQWVSAAHANPTYQSKSCPEDILIGPPLLPLQCGAHVSEGVWYPCGHEHKQADYWIEVSFLRPVVAVAILVFLGDDGLSDDQREPVKLQVGLIDMHGATHDDSTMDATLSCQDNPVTFHVKQDLSQPFYLTQGLLLSFKSHQVALSAVALRSSHLINPVGMQICDKERGQLYDPAIGHCLDQACERPACEPLLVKHGDATCSGQEEGATCTVSCHLGYKLSVHNSHMACVGGSWHGANIKCEPVDCSIPEIPHAKTDCPHGTTLGKRCKFECRPPAHKYGTDHYVTCEADGLWSLPDAFCQVKCTAPPIVKNATLITKQCRKGVHELGTKCKLKCQKGYHVAGAPLRKKVLHYICSEEAAWRGPTCERVQCPTPDPVYTGLYSCSNKFYSGSRCTLKCLDPQRVTSSIQCQPSGQWDSEFVACKFPPGHCPDLRGTPQGIAAECSEASVGDQCEVSCTSPDQEVILVGGAEIENHGPTSAGSRDEGRVRSLVCTGQLRWFPRLRDLQCVEQCSKDFIGDGWCDSRNNRAHCQWDGGDCCPATVAGGVVQPFPATCLEECSCKDPDAQKVLDPVENHRKQTSQRKMVSKTLSRTHWKKFMSLLTSNKPYLVRMQNNPTWWKTYMGELHKYMYGY